MRQQWVDRNFARFLGIPAIRITDWTTGHGDLHWANLTSAPLVILDWEGWGRLPVGYDIGLLHAVQPDHPDDRRANPDPVRPRPLHAGGKNR